MLTRFKRFSKKHRLIDEMRCEINTLKYFLEKWDELL